LESTKNNKSRPRNSESSYTADPTYSASSESLSVGDMPVPRSTVGETTWWWSLGGKQVQQPQLKPTGESSKSLFGPEVNHWWAG